MECYSVIGKNEIMSFAATWMDYHIKWSQEIQTWYHLQNIFKEYKWTYLQKTEIDSHI